MAAKEFDVIVIGELNVDIILNHIAKFPEMGKEILAQDLDVTLGSSSAIFASNLSSLGARVAFIGKVGNDGFADTVVNTLKAKNVDTSHIIHSDKLNTGATIVLNFDQDRAMVTYPGAMEDLSLADIDFDFLAKAKHLHLSSIFLQPGIYNDVATLFRKAKEMGLTTSLDPQWDPAEKWQLDLKMLLPQVDIFMPNIKELMFLAHSGSLDSSIEKLQLFSHNLVVKNGSEGAYLWDGESLMHQPAFNNSEVVDCIGAGDSFNAGFIRKFIDSAPLSECLRFGALTGAISTIAAGGTGAFVDVASLPEISRKKFNTSFF